MQALVEVILPVFLVIGFGYIAVWRGSFPETATDALMLFTQKFAIPCLLFSAIASLDLSSSLQPALLFSFYAGATISFAAATLGARVIFKRDWEDSVAIGFIGLFSNSVLLGLPITERAYGPDALGSNYVIVAFHAPFCYALGITVMEVVRAKGAPSVLLVKKVLNAIFRNALILGITAGFVVNLLGVPLLQVFTDSLDMMIRAALPAALFGLGGVLYRYRPEGDIRTIVFVCAMSMIVHPVVVYVFGSISGLSKEAFRSAVLTAAMAPGVNTYLFADMYGRARRVAASSVLFGTAGSILTIWVWLAVLG